MIYDRVSKLNQRSVADQEKLNRAACAANGWNIAAVYADDGISASRFARKEREDWPQLVAELDAGRYGVLVMWESSRGDRKAGEWLDFLDICRDRAVLIHITSHGRTYDVRIARDWRSLAEDGVDSAYESEKTRDRILRTTASTAAAGKPHGKILYGYRREYDARTGALSAQLLDETPRAAIAGGCVTPLTGPLPVTWYTPVEVIREAARMVLAGHSLIKIATVLNRRGIPTPRRALLGWRPEQVKEQVTNPGYIARRVHRGKDVGPATWPAILDERDFYTCLARLTDPARKIQRDPAIKHLLSGIAECGVCHALMRVVKNRGALSYSCWRRAPGTGAGSAFHVARLEWRLNTLVEDVIVARLVRLDAEPIWAADDQPDQLRNLLEEIDAKTKRLDAFYIKAAAGELSDVGLAKIEAMMLPEIERLKQRAKSIRSIPAVDDLVHPDREVVAARWAALDMPRKREVIRALIQKIEVLPVGKGRRNYNDWDPDVTRITWRGMQDPGSDPLAVVEQQAGE
ncbi:recombinase family protein [Microbispora sp. NPDC004025]